MKDIFHDPEFEKMLYGGMKDLDEQVGGIVYKLFKAGFIKTTWSCEGHAARSYDGYNAHRQGYYVYGPGRMTFEYPDDKEMPKTGLLINKVEGLVSKYPFAKLTKDDGGKKIELTLEMKDLVEPIEQVAQTAREDIVAAFAQGMYEISRRREVKIELAEARLAHFYKFWEELETIVDEVIDSK
jgi:hypothetical protein